MNPAHALQTSDSHKRQSADATALGADAVAAPLGAFAVADAAYVQTHFQASQPFSSPCDEILIFWTNSAAYLPGGSLNMSR